jgi:protein-S-isoprenylcysteine O-methyltransferase Ste14
MARHSTKLATACSGSCSLRNVRAFMTVGQKARDRTDPPPVNVAVRAGRCFFPWRIIVGLCGVAAGAYVIHPRNLFGQFQAAGATISFALIALGLGLRAWAAACAGGHTRTGHIEAPRLVTGGPYAFVRNPLYLGSFVLGLGVVGLLGDPWLLVPHLLVFTVFFGMIVPAEEQFLKSRFGDEYTRFRKAVPKAIPRINPWNGRVEYPRRWRAARGELLIGLVVLAIYVGFRAILFFRG